MRNILSFSSLPSPFFTSPWSLSPLFLPGITLEGKKGGKVTKGVYNNNKKMARERLKNSKCFSSLEGYQDFNLKKTSAIF
jgi:hypothetical protein